MLRIQTSDPLNSAHPTTAESAEIAKIEVKVRKSGFPIGDDDDCENGECLEVDRHSIQSSAFYVRNVRGGERLQIKLENPKVELDTVTAVSAIEDSGVDKMNELRKSEQCFLYQDILSNGGTGPAVDINDWLEKSFRSSQNWFSWESEYSMPYADQIICVVKEDKYDVADNLSEKSARYSVITEDLHDVEPMSFLSQIHDTVVHHPYVVGFGIGYVVYAISKAIIKRMRPRRARRRI